MTVSGGDLRQAVTLLQTAKKLCTEQDTVSPEAIYDMTGVILL